MALLHDINLHILLLYSIIDIAILSCFLFEICSTTIIGLLRLNNIIVFAKIIF